MRLLAIILIAVTIASCSGARKTQISSAPASAGLSRVASVGKSTDDGLSYETAIVIEETSEGKGVAAEYAWIRKYYPGYKSTGQSLKLANGKSYDVLTIQDQAGDKKEIYFDISNFFGKF